MVYKFKCDNQKDNCANIQNGKSIFKYLFGILKTIGQVGFPLKNRANEPVVVN